MGIAEKVEVRFARTGDFAWCITEDDLVDAEVVRRKIGLKEIIVAEMEGQIVGYLRL